MWGWLCRVPVKIGQKEPVDQAAPSIAHYSIQAGLPQFSAYLKGLHSITVALCVVCSQCGVADMGAVAFEVGLGHMTDPSMVIGRAVVPDLVVLMSKRQVSGYDTLVL